MELLAYSQTDERWCRLPLARNRGAAALPPDLPGGRRGSGFGVAYVDAKRG
jgi:hypothetical protein